MNYWFLLLRITTHCRVSYLHFGTYQCYRWDYIRERGFFFHHWCAIIYTFQTAAARHNLNLRNTRKKLSYLPTILILVRTYIQVLRKCSVRNWPFLGHSPSPIGMPSIPDIIQILNDDVKYQLGFELKYIVGFSNPPESPLDESSVTETTLPHPPDVKPSPI